MLAQPTGQLSRGASLTAELANDAVGLLVDSDGADGILMRSLKLGIGLGLSLKIHLAEHVKSRLLASASSTRPCLALNGPSKLPSVLVTAKAVRFAILLIPVSDTCRTGSSAEIECLEDIRGLRR